MKNSTREKIFPFFKKRENIIYLDSAVTTIKPKIVINEIRNFYEDLSFSIDRTRNQLNNIVEEKFNNSIKEIANFINANENEIIPSSGTTDGINKICRSLKKEIKEGDEIIIGEFEHASNFLPWLKLANEKKAKIVFYKLNDNFKIDLKHLSKIVNEKTKIISIAHKYNTFGSTNEIEKIRKIIGDKVYFIVDAAQSIGQIEIDIKKIDCDFLVFSGHKMFGPTGIGIIFGKEEILKNIEPFDYGGGMNVNYSLKEIILKDVPKKFYAGTPNVSGIIALGKAIEFINTELGGVKKIKDHNEKLKFYLEKKLLELENIEIINKNVESSICIFKVKNVSGEDVAFQLQKEKIFLRWGSLCVKTANKKIYNQEDLLRASFHIYNNESDIDKLISELKNGGDFLDGLFEKRKTNKLCK